MYMNLAQKFDQNSSFLLELSKLKIFFNLVQLMIYRIDMCIKIRGE